VNAETADIEVHPQPSPLWLELARVVAETERRLDGETTQPTFAGDADAEVG
jgi:hypothetical protein